ncbi:RraA family protein [Pseudothauera rhizosphaerae]|uniref:Putative 4-hydroxy-4-methyl-2-oxoglutarate aldolase n=1 Tax=Pseudothauera rhizosphaerae TaxID=2565932 RepID=A0A4S4AZ17_9RHOO|nr:RraA family protein [Pseudothauera rhizosphaerae]THF65253.1 RraA family protein [Pseudothauera rhizosphaerae]
MNVLPFLPATPHPDVARDLAALQEPLQGLLPARLIRRVHIERPPAALVEGYRALPDLCSLVADVLDGLGYDTAVPAGRLAPLASGQRVVGPAVTVRHSRVRRAAGVGLARGDVPRLGGLDQIALTRSGDVLVIDAGGEGEASSFGGLMANAVRHGGLAGVVVDGAVRDAANIRALGLPLWSRTLTPRTGKHRLELVEFNGVVDIGGVQVWPGDLLLGDDDGLLVVPAAIAADVLDRARAAAGLEHSVLAAMAAGASAGESLAILPPEKW